MVETHTHEASPGWVERVPPAYWLLALILLVMPAFANDFVLRSIFGWTFYLGIIALSLMFLAGYGGMVSLVQMTIAGVGGYMVAIFGPSAIETISLGCPGTSTSPWRWSWRVLFGTIAGWLAVRTEGIYTIMITLAIAAAWFYFTNQNYVIFNWLLGFQRGSAARLFGVDWQSAVPFLLSHAFLGDGELPGGALPLARALWPGSARGARQPPPDGGAGLQCHGPPGRGLFFRGAPGRDRWHPADMAIGPDLAGDCGHWTGDRRAGRRVIGGLRHPIGPFIGAFIYVMLKTFAIDALIAVGLSADRFQLLIGVGFLIIVYWSPDGSLGLWEKISVPRATRIRCWTVGGGAMNAQTPTTISGASWGRPAPRMRWSCAGLEILRRARGDGGHQPDRPPGERRAVLGSNGAGKTTLFNCVTGDFPSTSGSIRFFGEDITDFPPQERIRRACGGRTRSACSSPA